MSQHPVVHACLLKCKRCLTANSVRKFKTMRTLAGLAGPRVLEKGRPEVPSSSSSSSSGSDADCDAACDEEAAGAGARRQNRRAYAACSTSFDASCNAERVLQPGVFSLSSTSSSSSRELSNGAGCLSCAQGMVGRRPKVRRSS